MSPHNFAWRAKSVSDWRTSLLRSRTLPARRRGSSSIAASHTTVSLHWKELAMFGRWTRSLRQRLRANPRRRSTRLHLECLEVRELLATNFDATIIVPSGGTGPNSLVL